MIDKREEDFGLGRLSDEDLVLAVKKERLWFESYPDSYNDPGYVASCAYVLEVIEKECEKRGIKCPC